MFNILFSTFKSICIVSQTIITRYWGLVKRGILVSYIVKLVIVSLSIQPGSVNELCVR